MPGGQNNINSNFQHLFKIILVGETESGKSTLIKKFVDNGFVSNYVATIGIDFSFKTITIGNANCKIQIWDTSGAEKFRTLAQAYYRGSCAVIICYNSNKPFDLNKIKEYLKEVHTFGSNDPIIILVATRCDENQDYKINQSDLVELKGCLPPNQLFEHFYASAKTGKNVEAIFNHIAILELRKITENAIQEMNQHKKSLSSASSNPGGTLFLPVKKQGVELSYLENNIFCQLYKRFAETRYFQGLRQAQLQEFGRIYLKLQELINDEAVLCKLLVLFDSQNSWKVEGSCNNPEHQYAVFVKTLRDAQSNEGPIIEAFKEFKTWKEEMDENVELEGVQLADLERHREVLKALASPDKIEKSFFNWFGY